jgi:hypothetical protein
MPFYGCGGTPSPGSGYDDYVKKQGSYGGLKYKVLSEYELQRRFDAGYDQREFASRILGGMTGYEIAEIFGTPTYMGWSEINSYKNYGSWALEIQDLGIVEIFDWGVLTPVGDKDNPVTEADNNNFYANSQWKLSVLTSSDNRGLTAEQCDHAMHFFGDSVFKDSVRLPFDLCAPSSSPQPPSSEQKEDTESSGEQKSEKRGRGRPPGAKNRPKSESEDKPKRGRGRPPGSKNKRDQDVPSTPAPSAEPEREDAYDDRRPSEFIRFAGFNIFDRLRTNDQQAFSMVYDWLAKLPEDTTYSESLITPRQMKTLIDLLMGQTK